jgi:hypothetical protein
MTILVTLRTCCALVDLGIALMAQAVPLQTWAAPSWRRYAQDALAAWASKCNNQTANSSGGGSGSGGSRGGKGSGKVEEAAAATVE